MVHEFNPPLSIRVPFHMYFKLHWCTVYYSVLQVPGRERGQSKYLRSQRGIELKASSTEVLILIDYKGTNPCSLNRGSASKYRVIQVTGMLQFVTLQDVSQKINFFISACIFLYITITLHLNPSDVFCCTHPYGSTNERLFLHWSLHILKQGLSFFRIVSIATIFKVDRLTHSSSEVYQCITSITCF